MAQIYYEMSPAPQTDGTNIVINSSGEIDLGTDITTKLSNFGSDNKLLDSALSTNVNNKLAKVGEQILGVVSGNKATFTDAKIGSSTSYLSEVYCSDSARYIKSQTVSGNTLTVTFDDSVVGTTCVLQLFKKGV